MNKPYDEACALIEDMAQNHFQRGSWRSFVEKSPQKGGLYKVSTLDHMNTKVEALYQNIDILNITHAVIAAVVTPNREIYRVVGPICDACQLMVVTEPILGQMN